METIEAANECMHAVVKGKRTKRQRLLFRPPAALPATSAAASSTSSSSSTDFSASTTITEEEEDMANCLILLATGRSSSDARTNPETPVEDLSGTDGNGKPGFFVHECKTCNKCFPSFQALGGHRASHKKSRPPPAPRSTALDEEDLRISLSSVFKPAVLPPASAGAKAKVHECSICGAEFASGQALGGHMRRHRPVTVVSEAREAKRAHSLLALDLNLPAPPCDDELVEFERPASKVFGFVDKRRPLLFSPAALVDCHY